MELSLVFDDLGDFVQAYKGRVSVEGMELETDTEHPAGTVLELNIALRDELVLIQGNAGVLRSREDRGPSGSKYIMLLRFVELDDDSKSLIERMEERHQAEGVPPFNLEKALENWTQPPPRHVGKPGVAEAMKFVRPPGAEPKAPAQEPIRADIAAQAASQARSAEDGEVLHAVANALEPGTKPGLPYTESDADPEHESSVSRTLGAVPRPVVVGLVAVTLAVAVVAAVAFFIPELVGLSGGDGEAPEQVATPTEPAVDQDQTVPDPPEDTTAGTNPMVAGLATALPVRTTSEPTSAETLTETPTETPTVAPVPTPPPTPEPADPTPVPEAAAATHADEISWSTEGNVTEAIIHGNGSFSESRVTHFRLDSDPGPRIVLQIKRIQGSSVSLSRPVDGARIATIRSWHHSDRRPPELQVVFDLADPGVSLESVTAIGNTIVVRLISP